MAALVDEERKVESGAGHWADHSRAQSAVVDDDKDMYKPWQQTTMQGVGSQKQAQQWKD